MLFAFSFYTSLRFVSLPLGLLFLQGLGGGGGGGVVSSFPVAQPPTTSPSTPACPALIPNGRNSEEVVFVLPVKLINFY